MRNYEIPKEKHEDFRNIFRETYKLRSRKLATAGRYSDRPDWISRV